MMVDLLMPRPALTVADLRMRAKTFTLDIGHLPLSDSHDRRRRTARRARQPELAGAPDSESALILFVIGNEVLVLRDQLAPIRWQMQFLGHELAPGQTRPAHE